MKTPAHSSMSPITLDRGNGKPLSVQIHAAIVQAIFTGSLKPGARLPSTRILSSELGVSRNTVKTAFEQLTAEGYVEGAVGVGTRIAEIPPAGILSAARSQRASKGRILRLSRRGGELSRVTITLDQVEGMAGAIGDPELHLFPWKIWKKLVAQQIDQVSPSVFGYGSSLGFPPLREQIASYLERTRGICVPSDRVIVVTGAQQALYLMARMLLDPGDRVLLEDPGYPGARAAFTAAGAHISPVPVDAEGMEVGSLRFSQRQARAAYVTPAHQFPLGSTMSLRRRLALLEWAEEQNAYILEDDYDGDFRHTGRAISAIASLNSTGRVIYIGSFSKILFPSLRLGFVVVPEELTQQIASVRGFIDRHSAGIEQATLAAFMEQGYFSRHVRNMRAIYTERLSALISALSHSSDLFDTYAPETGAQLIVKLRAIGDKRAAQAIGPQEIAVAPVSSYYAAPRLGNSLLLGFASTSISGIQRSARNITRALRNIRKRPRR